MSARHDIRNPLASRVIDREPLYRNEVRDLNRVSKLLTKYGAISAERTAKLAKLDNVRSAQWALFMLGAVPVSSAGLFIWP